jgi:hypothetical protein
MSHRLYVEILQRQLLLLPLDRLPHHQPSQSSSDICRTAYPLGSDFCKAPINGLGDPL